LSKIEFFSHNIFFFSISDTIDEGDFNNLDPLVQQKFFNKYDKEVLSKLLRGSNKEGSKERPLN
jgi:hypothetical protein